MPKETPATPDKLRDEHLKLLYTENATIARTFLDWRHKVITIYSLFSGGALVMARWFWESTTLYSYAWIPLVVGGVFCASLAMMDRVNMRILRAAYRIGTDIERELRPDGGIYRGIYTFIGQARRVTYTRILCVLFWLSAIAFLAAAASVPYLR